jgi:sugar/nucleoside kinase (ribokinase family)
MGVVTSLDFSLPDSQSESGKLDWQQIMQRVLPFTDIFVPSLEEVLQIMMPDLYATFLSANHDSDVTDLIPVSVIREMGKNIIELGVKILLIKAGHRGIYFLTGDISILNNKAGFNLSEDDWNYQELWCNAYPADQGKIINATGAGDTAIAAFLSAILEGETAESSLKLAAMAGRNNLYCHNIYEELPVWNEMAQEIAASPNNVICLIGQLSEIK